MMTSAAATCCRLLLTRTAHTASRGMGSGTSVESNLTLLQTGTIHEHSQNLLLREDDAHCTANSRNWGSMICCCCKSSVMSLAHRKQGMPPHVGCQTNMGTDGHSY